MASGLIVCRCTCERCSCMPQHSAAVSPSPAITPPKSPAALTKAVSRENAEAGLLFGCKAGSISDGEGPGLCFPLVPHY